MAFALKMQAMVEPFQQMLECQRVCFVFGCPDAALRHPLLEIVPEHFLPVICAPPSHTGHTWAAKAWQDEEVQALCDLAIQSGHMQTVRARGPFARQQGLRSLAALPLESARGVFGTFLLGDERADQFGVGERRLLYACLSMRLPALEQALWQQAVLTLHTGLKRAISARTGGTSSDAAAWPEQFIRSDFVSMIGHELRAPLSVIKGYAALLQAYGEAEANNQRLEPEQRRRYLEALVEQSDLLELLVNDLLDISRLQRGDLILRPGIVDIEALCRQVIQFGQLRADQRAPGKYRLECRCATPLIPMSTDAARLQQVLMNVLENAIKYSPEGGTIELTVGMPEGRDGPVVITVRDPGIGIPARRLGDLFQPFERLERSATTHIAGMGLGLYLARKLVEAMNGNLELQSCEGSGTNVTIRLPAVMLDKRLATDAMVQASIL